MRKSFVIYAMMLIVSVSACETVNPGTGVSDDGRDPKSMYISVDKTVIESDGKDKAVFTVTDGAGNVLSTYANMGSVFYKNVDTGVRLPMYSESFSSVADGTFRFVGIVGGKETVDTVTITSTNRAAYEVFHRNVAVFKLTATWCPNCPAMTTALNSLDDDAKAHTVVLACHNSDAFSVRCGESDLAGAAALKINPNLTTLALPSLVYDLSVMDGSRATSGIMSHIMQRRVESPAAAGIKVEEFLRDGNVLTVKAAAKASASGVFDMACAVLADGLYDASGNAENGIYNDVVIAISSAGNILSCARSTSFSLDENEEYSREFTFTLPDDFPQEYLNGLKAVVLLHKMGADGVSEVNNCVLCPYSMTKDYEYND
ncbi:MAG: hypothetical protein IJ005_02740 [Bacteroidales bacterium]|nr:hypothetical protein [Bacteroidales bacterium]